MKDWDIGITVPQDPYAYIGIKQNNGRKYIIMVNKKLWFNKRQIILRQKIKAWY